MKKTILILTMLCLCFTANAQFRRSSDSAIYPYQSSPRSNDVAIIARIGITNYNVYLSNLLTLINGINAATATNIAAYQAYLATNGWTTTSTNIAAYQAFLATNNFTGTSLRYPTNLGNATYIDVGNKYTGFATNDNISISGCANVDSSGTNISWGILTITNTAGSAAAKTIAIPAAWVDVDNLGGTTIYNTNQGILSVMVYPNLGTNFIWRGK